MTDSDATKNQSSPQNTGTETKYDDDDNQMMKIQTYLKFNKKEEKNNLVKRVLYFILIRILDKKYRYIEINNVKRELKPLILNKDIDGYYLRVLCTPDDIHDLHIKLEDNTLISTNDFTDIKFDDPPKDIEEQKEYKTKQMEIYMAKLNCLCKTVLSVQESKWFDAYLSSWGRPTGDEDDDWKRTHALFDGAKWYYIWTVYCLNSKQIYYDKFYKIVYCIETSIARKAMSFGGLSQVYAKGWYYKEHMYDLCKYARKRSDNMHLDPYWHQNITEPLWLADRYSYIKEDVLYGQDNEFNIFRSMCFVEGSWLIRLPIALLCLVLQFILTVGIVIEVIDNWDVEEMFDSDSMIITISFVVFTFISYTYTWAIYKFFKFYLHASFLMKISRWIISFDFISNVVIGFVVCFVSFAYLLQSETIADVVLNSFALTFILQLDDLANLFESDEDHLMRTDWKMLMDSGRHGDGNYNSHTRRREVMIPWVDMCLAICGLLLSPLLIIGSLIACCWVGYTSIIHSQKMKRRDALFRAQKPFDYDDDEEEEEEEDDYEDGDDDDDDDMNEEDDDDEN